MLAHLLNKSSRTRNKMHMSKLVQNTFLYQDVRFISGFKVGILKWEYIGRGFPSFWGQPQVAIRETTVQFSVP